MKSSVNVTTLFRTHVIRKIYDTNTDKIHPELVEETFKSFTDFVKYIMHNPKKYIISSQIGKYTYWTAGRKYHSKHMGYVEDYEDKNCDINYTLSTFANARVYLSFFEYLIRITRDRTMKVSREDLNLYKDGRRKNFIGDPDSAFTHSSSYITIGNLSLSLDFMNIYDAADKSCGAYIVTCYQVR